MPFVDFAEIRERLPIEDAAEMLPVKWSREGEQLRATCPVHGGDRALIVTPTKGLFVCKASPDEKKGGDCIALCAHVMQTTMYEAGQYLGQQLGMLERHSTVKGRSTSNSTVRKERATSPQKQEGGANRPANLQKSGGLVGSTPEPIKAFDPQAFSAKLTYTDEVAALGFSEADAERFGVGVYRGKFYVPLRYSNGSIACFLDYASGTLKAPARNRWLEPSNVVPMVRKSA